MELYASSTTDRVIGTQALSARARKPIKCPHSGNVPRLGSDLRSSFLAEAAYGGGSGRNACRDRAGGRGHWKVSLVFDVGDRGPLRESDRYMPTRPDRPPLLP